MRGKVSIELDSLTKIDFWKFLIDSNNNYEVGPFIYLKWQNKPNAIRKIINEIEGSELWTKEESGAKVIVNSGDMNEVQEFYCHMQHWILSKGLPLWNFF
jgi:hypothetical protein